MRILCLAALPVVISLLGCGGGAGKPDDLPPLTPCTLTVMYQGSPLTDATVTLTPESGKWVGVGQTDESGKVEVRTNGQFEGVPAGTYTVTVKKQEQPTGGSDPSSAEEDAAMAATKASAPKLLVPKKYTEASTSGLSVQVSDSPVDETLELTD